MNVIVFLLLYVGLNMILTNIYIVPTKRSIKYLRKPISSKSNKDKLYKIIDPIAICIRRLIRPDQYKKNSMEAKLKRCKIDIDYEMFIARAIAISMMTFIFSFVFIIVKIYIAAATCMLLSVAMYFSQIQKPDDEIKKINESILKEFPRFVSTFAHSLSSTNDLVKIFEKYKKVAGESFVYDLEVLISDLQTGNQEQALKNFDERLGIAQISDFVVAAIGIVHGTQQREYLKLVEMEAKNLLREQIKREIAERPNKIMPVLWITVLGCILLFMTPVILSLADGLAIFR